MGDTLEEILSAVIAAKEQTRPYGAAWYALARVRDGLREAIAHVQEEERQAARETLGAYGFNGPFTNR